MRKVITASLMALALGATAASADVKVGLGYTITDGLSGSLTGQPANIRIPIDFDFGLRIEPELGFGSYTDEDNNFKDEGSTVTVAIGGYYNLWKVEKVDFYAGGRLAVSSGTDDSTNKTTGVTTTTDSDNVALQGLFGAEYMFTEDFSFSAQAGLEAQSGSRGNRDTTSTGTVAHLLIHYFF